MKKSKLSTVLKIIGICIAVAAAIAGICLLVKKLAAKKQAEIAHPEEEELLTQNVEDEFSAVAVEEAPEKDAE